MNSKHPKKTTGPRHGGDGRFIPFCPDVKAITSLYVTDKKTHAEIAAIYGVHTATVGRYLRGIGVESRWAQNSWLRICPKKALVDLYCKRKMTQLDIATHLGCSIQPVQTAFEHYGLVPRSRQDPVYRKYKEENTGWKGNDAKYKAMHARLYRYKGKPKHCEVCGTTDARKKYDWHNPTKEYADMEKYQRVCKGCHMLYHDKRRKRSSLGRYE